MKKGDVTPLPTPFPKEIRLLSAQPRFKNISLAKELAFQTARIAERPDTLCAFFEAISELNDVLFARDSVKSRVHIENIIDEYGYSFVLLRKLAYLQTMAGDNPETNRFIKDLLGDGLSDHQVSAYMTMYEILDPSDDEWYIFRKRREEISHITSIWWIDFIESLFWPHPQNETQFYDRFLTYSTFSVADSIFFLLTEAQIIDVHEIGITKDQIVNSLPPTVTRAWYQAFSNQRIYQRPDYKSGIGFFEPEFFLKRSIAFQEYSDMKAWRAAIDRCLYTRIVKRSSDTERPAQCSKVYFGSDLRLRELTTALISERPDLQRYHNTSATVRARTAAAMYCLQRGQTLCDLDQFQLRVLLNGTMQLSDLLTKAEMEEVYRHAQAENHLVISFLILCMLYWADPSDDIDHAVRTALQAAVSKEFVGDLISFLEWLSEQTPAISHVVVRICDIEFLERLYILIPSYEEVLATRANICEWAGNKFNVPEYIESSKRIRTDIKVRRVKDQIDDTRIFIDEMRFRLWMEEYLNNDWRRLSRTQLFDEAEFIMRLKVTTKTAKSLDSVVGINRWIVTILQTAFSEFCENNSYGITSFLGRRIRHGTLIGFLFSPVDALFEEKRYRALESNDDFSLAKKRWQERYRSEITYIRDRQLFFRSDDHPDGVFSSNILSSQERISIVTATAMLLIQFSVEKRQIADTAPQISAFCWQVLQTELLRYRRYILQDLIPKIKRSIADEFSAISENSFVHQLMTRLDHTVSARLQAFSTWFDRSETALASFSIRELADAVISEFRAYNLAFRPRVTFVGPVDDTVYGNLYHNIYDCLFVLIGNAAQHGQAEGDLIVSVRNVDQDGQSVCEIGVTSECDDTHIIAQSEKVRQAMKGDGITNPMIAVQRSGLGKLRHIVETAWAVRAQTAEGHIEFLTKNTDITISFRLPFIRV